MATACGTPAGTLFNATIQQPDGSNPLPVVLGDETGLVTGIEVVSIDWPAGVGGSTDGPFVQPDTSDPNAIVVFWITGACENDVAMSFKPVGAGFDLHVAVHGKFGSCTANALFRQLRIRFSRSIPATQITATLGI